MEDYEPVVMNELSEDGKFRLKIERTDKPFKSDHHHGRLTVMVEATHEVILDEEVGLVYPDLDGMTQSVQTWFELADAAVDKYLARVLQ